LFQFSNLVELEILQNIYTGAAHVAGSTKTSTKHTTVTFDVPKLCRKNIPTDNGKHLDARAPEKETASTELQDIKNEDHAECVIDGCLYVCVKKRYFRVKQQHHKEKAF